MRSISVLTASLVLAGACSADSVDDHRTDMARGLFDVDLARGDSAPRGPCTNHTRDGDESDVDCGGTVCGPCGTGGRCTEDRDCTSMLCTGGVCVGMAGCADGHKDGRETDVDCGGPDCVPCG